MYRNNAAIFRWALASFKATKAAPSYRPSSAFSASFSDSPVQGFRVAGVACGIKKQVDGKAPLDLALIYSEKPCTAAGVFTQNKIRAAPVTLCEDILKKNGNNIQSVVINAGNANCCTGEKGALDAQEMSDLVSQALNCPPTLVCSTGVIGQPLDMARIRAGISSAVASLGGENWEDTALAIMTTDSHPKHITKKFPVAGREVSMTGIAKGSGMIHPNMATLLGTVVTDAAVSPKILKLALQQVTDKTFNRITVDGDTSTNDSCIILANGMAGNAEISSENSEDYRVFCEALLDVLKPLARMIVKDGEGVTKMMDIQVSGARTDAEATAVAKSIGTSNLVKTAMFGNDANWGRILCAIGYANAEVDPSLVSLTIASGDNHKLQLLRNGQPCM
eukprot:TRINITY_DN550_c0_g1_i2.p1 TRINITY_DN550_c0_g1~~TRINITY_DN550_c0_g1_i2.p1  ORF type:complete len:392 (+),score=67.14 TRINITY_DN550_c0_g1_i2:372-1547(+)